MKKGIGLIAFGGKNWIGGIYYIRSIAYQLSINENITDVYKIYVLTQDDLKDAFSDLPDNVEVLAIQGGKKNLPLFLLKLITYNIKIIYPSSKGIALLGIKPLWWIPDFQYKYLPDMFSNEDIKAKDEDIKHIVNKRTKIIFSSKACEDDLFKFFSPDKKQTGVMHFVSYIEPIVNSLTTDFENEVLSKFGIVHQKYICIMNQFWQHKNHKVILDAMRLYFQANPKINFKFVFTGKLEDYRCPEYIDELKILFEEDIIKRHSVLLGFIDRDEQIAIMKNAEYIIQPSLFEGWGTVLEDAKVLDKTVLLSDIPVHREQMSKKCILFNPHDPVALAKLIEKESQKEHIDDIERGVADMHERAKEYSKGFEQLLKDFERKKL